MSDDVRAAAERLLNEDEVEHILYGTSDRTVFEQDIQTVANYALEAGREVARLRAGIAVSNAFVEWALPMLEYAERSVPPVLEVRITVKPWIRAVRELRDGIAVARAALEAGQEVERLRAALLEFIHAYANVERLDHDGVEIELFKAWIHGCSTLGIKAEGHRAALSTPGGPESSELRSLQDQDPRPSTWSGPFTADD